ncbi:MAG: AMP-binding protein [Pirellulales bacterium]
MNDLWQSFQYTVRRVPDRPAIVMGEQIHSFADLAQRAEDFRASYIAAGLEPDSRILLWVENCFDLAAALTAAWGCQAIPVLMDGGCRTPQLEHAIAIVEPRIVVHRAPLPSANIGDSVSLYTDDVPAGTGQHQMGNQRILPTDPASVVFTSGSTGRPKGVIQSHANLYRGCCSVYNYLQFCDEDIILCPVPWSFDYGYGQLLTTLLCGLTQVLPTMDNPFGMCKAIEQQRPTVMAGTPSLFAYLMGGMSPIDSTDVSSLRLLTNTGGRLSKPLIDTLLQQFKTTQLVLNYGLTETYRSCYIPPNQLREKSASIGLPIPGVDVVVIREDGSQAAPFEEGEIVHRGDYVFLGYWGDAKASAESLRRDPLHSPSVYASARAVYTGDLGYVDDESYIYYVGRKDQQIKSMGVRVSPMEVEELLYQSGQVAHATVFGMPHDLLGQEVWAAIVPSNGKAFAQNELKKMARNTMSQYMQPRKYMVLDALPRTSTGKPDYVSLLKRALEETE